MKEDIRLLKDTYYQFKFFIECCKKHYRNIFIKNRGCWKTLTKDEMIVMLDEHINKFKERGSNSKLDIADVGIISMMISSKIKRK